MKYILAFVLVATALGCTQNRRARSWGGTAKVTLPAGERLINVTWKDSDLWYLTEPVSDSNYTPRDFYFREKSSLGLMEGTYIIHESK
jgi:hypothetical protein